MLGIYIGCEKSSKVQTNTEVAVIDGLMFPRDPTKCGSGFTDTKGIRTVTWDEACSLCENLTYSGYSDWRLPSHKELKKIFTPIIPRLVFVNHSIVQVSYDTSIFYLQPDYYWTSSRPDFDYGEDVRICINLTGGGGGSGKSKDCMAYVICVRDATTESK